MKNILVLFIVLFAAYTTHARELNIPAVEKSISNQIQANVKIESISQTLNPLSIALNMFDLNKIEKIKLSVNGKEVVCDFVSYDYAQRVRIVNCDSNINITAAAFVVENMFVCGNSAVINGKKIRSAFDLHSSFVTQLCFPHYYGHNLDALYDTLVSIEKPTQILVKNTSHLKKSLSQEKYEALLLLLKEAAAANRLLTIKIK